ncbi:MAG: hypothetical protein ACLFTQ_00980 [Candidatus Aenigmatarchaeota archaeon]
MLRWSEFNIPGRKGQFFVISIAIIAASLVTIMNTLEMYGEIDLRGFHRYDENRIFRNIKEGVEETVDQSSCEYDDYPMRRDLNEFKEMAKKDIDVKGMFLNITYHEYCDGNDPNVSATVELMSHGFLMNETFQVS